MIPSRLTSSPTQPRTGIAESSKPQGRRQAPTP